jgi:hypothetical protein
MRLVGFTAEFSLIDRNDHYSQSFESSENVEGIKTAAGPRWGNFRPEHCRDMFTRQYSSILWDIPSGTSWESACRNTPAEINGQPFRGATRCVNTGFNIWGQFDVREDSCFVTPHTYNGPCGTTTVTGRSCVQGYDPYSRTTVGYCCGLGGPRWASITVYRDRPHTTQCNFPCVF